MKTNILTNIYFFGQFLRSPASVGSVCPSGRFLSRALVSAALENDFRGLIIDLGAGSGVVSRELLIRGVSPDRILAVDISRRFLKIFRSQCPGIELRVGDARNLSKIISSKTPALPVQAVISSLPLKSMPARAVNEIMLEISRILRENGGVLIQYTYAIWVRSALENFGFFTRERRLVPLNLPPALVEKYSPKI